MTTPWWFTVLTSLLSGFIGSLIVMAINNKKEKEREKISYKRNIFQSLIAFRGDIADNYPSSGNFIISLNQVFVAFNDNQNVIDAFERCRKNMTNDNIISLLKEMAKDLNIDYQFANDDLFLNPLLDWKIAASVQQR